MTTNAPALAPTVALRASRIEPMSGAGIDDGTIICRGSKIVAMGPARQTLADHPVDQLHDFGQAVILPGLINAHTHLELSALSLPPAISGPPTLTNWLGEVVRQNTTSDPTQSTKTSMTIGIDACLAFGVSTVGDITRNPALSRLALLHSPLNGISFGEVTAMASRRGLLDERIAAAIEPMQLSAPRSLEAGISPHAPYSIEVPGIARCLESARDRNLAITIHLAESPDEAKFLAQQTGPFRELWQRIGGWDDLVPRFAGGPIRLARDAGLLAYPRTLLAHVNYCDDDEMQLLANGSASVVFCPRTHRYFGHPPHRWREMLDRGINVCVGTDSTASSPNLNPVDDLRLLFEIAPDMPPRTLWELLTTRAARTLGLESERGHLAVGSSADCVVFDFEGNDPLRWILDSRESPAAVFMDGKLQLRVLPSRSR